MIDFSKRRTTLTLAAAIGALALLAPACARREEPPARTASPAVSRAVAELRPTSGHTVAGRVDFEQTPQGVRVSGRIQGLAPGEHGFHVHETGDCSAPDASSAGGHFNPTGAPHAGPEAGQRHAGDLGNVSADASGAAEISRTDAHLTLEGPHTLVGRAVVVHERRDDLTSQPAGDAGGRVACGVIVAGAAGS